MTSATDIPALELSWVMKYHNRIYISNYMMLGTHEIIDIFLFLNN